MKELTDEQRQNVILEDLITYVIATAESDKIDLYLALRRIVEEYFQILPRYLQRMTYHDISLCMSMLHGKWIRENLRMDILAIGPSQCEIKMLDDCRNMLLRSFLDSRIEQLKQQVCTSGLNKVSSQSGLNKLSDTESFEKAFVEMKKRVYVSPREIEELVNLLSNILRNSDKKNLDQFLNFVFTQISSPPSSHPSLTDIWLNIVKAILQILKNHGKLEHTYQDRTLLFKVALNMAKSFPGFSIGTIQYPSKIGYFCEILKYLITLGANVNVQGPTGKSLLQYLKDNSHPEQVAEVLGLLREKAAGPSDSKEGTNTTIANSGFFKGSGSSEQVDVVDESPRNQVDLTS